MIKDSFTTTFSTTKILDFSVETMFQSKTRLSWSLCLCYDRNNVSHCVMRLILFFPEFISSLSYFYILSAKLMSTKLLVNLKLFVTSENVIAEYELRLNKLYYVILIFSKTTAGDWASTQNSNTANVFFFFCKRTVQYL